MFKKQEEPLDKSKPFVSLKKNLLTIYSPHAKKPALWHANLDQLEQLLFLIEKKGAAYNLCFGKGDDQEVIASFTKKAEATEIYEQVAFVLKGYKASSASSDSNDEEEEGGLFKGFIIFLAFFVILYIGMNMFFSEETPNYSISDRDVTETLKLYEKTFKNKSNVAPAEEEKPSEPAIDDNQIEDGVIIPLDQLIQE